MIIRYLTTRHSAECAGFRGHIEPAGCLAGQELSALI